VEPSGKLDWRLCFTGDENLGCLNGVWRPCLLTSEVLETGTELEGGHGEDFVEPSVKLGCRLCLTGDENPGGLNRVCRPGLWVAEVLETGAEI